MDKFTRYLKKLGPGFITGASDDDPSGIGTYAITGAKFGYTQLWVPLLTFPLMTVIQEICGRIGMVTGKGLSHVIRSHYPKPILYFAVMLIFVANIVNIGADLGAMAASGQLIFHIPFDLWLFGLTSITILLEIFIPYYLYANYLRYLALSLAAYIITALIVKQNWTQILHSTFIPKFSLGKDYILNVVALFGTTISPYLFFWQASEEVETEVEEKQLLQVGEGEPEITEEQVGAIKIDTIIGMFFANLIMYSIAVTTAATLHRYGITSIETAPQAAQALRPLAGDWAFLLFALGIIGTGLLAIPVLAGSAAYAVAEMFGWKEGLCRKFHEAYGFYGVIGIATLLGLTINYLPIPPFKMLYYAAVLNGICSPPLMIIIMFISNNKNIMSKYKNSLFSNIFGWIITILMTVAALILFFDIFTKM